MSELELDVPYPSAETVLVHNMDNMARRVLAFITMTSLPSGPAGISKIGSLHVPRHLPGQDAVVGEGCIRHYCRASYAIRVYTNTHSSPHYTAHT